MENVEIRGHAVDKWTLECKLNMFRCIVLTQMNQEGNDGCRNCVNAGRVNQQMVGVGRHSVSVR